MTTQRPASLAAPRAKCAGLTLIEVLIALLVLSIGLLGLAGLQTVSLQFNTSAYYRTQATMLAYDLSDRMRANRQAALANAYNGGFEDPPPACNPAVGGGGSAAQDLAAWRNALACRLPQATGAVTLTGDNLVTITIRWDDSRGEEALMEFEFTTAL